MLRTKHVRTRRLRTVTQVRTQVRTLLPYQEHYRVAKNRVVGEFRLRGRRNQIKGCKNHTNTAV